MSRVCLNIALKRALFKTSYARNKGGGGSNPLTRFELLAAQAALRSIPVLFLKAGQGFHSGVISENQKIFVTGCYSLHP